MQLELLNEQGQATDKVDAPDTVFARDYNEALVHQVVVEYQANARQGTRAQKSCPRCCCFCHREWCIRSWRVAIFEKRETPSTVTSAFAVGTRSQSAASLPLSATYSIPVYYMHVSVI